MRGIGPFKECDLADDGGFQPAALLHLSAVSDPPQREALVSGRLVKGQASIWSFLMAAKTSSRVRGTKPFLILATKISRFFS